MSSLVVSGLGTHLLVTLGLGGGGSDSEFSVASATALDRFSVRVTFTDPPNKLNPASSHDALNPALWSLSGPGAATVEVVLSVPDDALSVDLFLSGALVAGDWTVTATDTIFGDDDETLVPPLSADFEVSALVAATPLDGGATEEERILRKHLNPVLAGPAWDALIEAIDDSDQDTWGDARAARDQMHVSSAGGQFLDRRAGDRGLARPSGVGMADGPFRTLALTLSNRRVTDRAMHDLLEAFYTADSTRAWLDADIGPYELRDGDTLELLFGEQRAVTVEFERADAQRIARATAAEVVAVINRQLRAAGVGGYAAVRTDVTTGEASLRLYSDARGLPSALRVLGGRAELALGFLDNLCPDLVDFGTWDVTASPDTPGRVRWTLSDATDFDLLLVRPGDRVLVYGEEFDEELRGTHEIVDVYVAYPGAVLTQWFEIESLEDMAQSAVSQVVASSLVFLRPAMRTIYDNPRRAYASQAGVGMTLTMPVTSPAVARTVGSASYLHSAAVIDIVDVDRTDTIVTVETDTAHGLTAGNQVFVDGLVGSRANGLFVVVEVASSTVFTYATEATSSVAWADGATCTPCAAPARGDIPGPYAWDPAGADIRGIRGSVATRLDGGRGHPTVVLGAGEADEFPDEVGYLAFRFGREGEIRPVRYLGRMSDTTLRLDASYVFGNAVAPGDSCILLGGPAAPTAPTADEGGFFLTASSAGRVAASALADDVAAGGIQLNKEIIYPGDRGLGAEGRPTEGVQRLSDAVAVWAGDQITEAVQAAREEE